MLRLVKQEKELLPCPFCENTDIRLHKHPPVHYTRGAVYSMGCYLCGATFPNRYSVSILIKEWNTRP